MLGYYYYYYYAINKRMGARDSRGNACGQPEATEGIEINGQVLESRVRGSRYSVDSDSMVDWIRKVEGDVAVQDKINDNDRHSFVYCFLYWRVRQVAH
jgi:hypothetical protein